MNSYLIHSTLQAEGVCVQRPIEVVYRSYEGSSPTIDDLTISVQSVKECKGTWKAGILAILDFIRTNNLHQYKIEIINHLHLDSVGIFPLEMPGMVRKGRPTDPLLALKDPARRIWLEEVVPMVLSIVGPKYEVDIWKSV
jgi:hypothetical protein